LVELNTAVEIDAMAAAGAVVAEPLRAVCDHARSEYTVAVTEDGARVLARSRGN